MRREDPEKVPIREVGVTGNHIDYKDDTGFTADGEFKEGILITVV